jgi:hypothetical protein
LRAAVDIHCGPFALGRYRNIKKALFSGHFCLHILGATAADAPVVEKAPIYCVFLGPPHFILQEMP